MPGPKRFGWGDRDYGRAQEALDELANDGLHHLVEVKDEGTFFTRSQPREPVGVLYVVSEQDLAVFLEQHEGSRVLTSAGNTPEQED